MDTWELESADLVSWLTMNPTAWPTAGAESAPPVEADHWRILIGLPRPIGWQMPTPS